MATKNIRRQIETDESLDMSLLSLSVGTSAEKPAMKFSQLGLHESEDLIQDDTNGLSGKQATGKFADLS